MNRRLARQARRIAPRLLFILGVNLAGQTSCNDAGLSLDTSCAARPIYGGAPGPSLEQLGIQQQLSIVALNIAGGAVCTGTVVAPGVVVTAAHCLSAPLPEVSFGIPRNDGAGRIVVSGAARHPSLDVGVLFFDAETLAPKTEPIPVLEGSVDDKWNGQPVELAGFGKTESGWPAAIRYAVERVTAIHAMDLVVSGQGSSGACFGDSGGPLLARDDEGRVRVAGILTGGDGTCVGRDRYIRMDVLASWWPFAWRSPGKVQGCENLDGEGECLRGNVIRCEAGDQLVVERCAEGTRCGELAGTRRFLCLPPEWDACNGAGSLPYCDGADLVVCKTGRLERSSCDACGGSCSNTGLAKCMGGRPLPDHSAAR